MFRKGLFLVSVIIIGMLGAAVILGGCSGDEGAQGPQGPQGPAGAQGPQGSSASAEDIEAAVRDVLAPGASAADIAAGGRLYDKWWKADAGATEPTAENALWALQSSNTHSGADTSRCKECHGWDQKGAGGAYSSGSHYTGFVGVYKAGETMSKDDLVGVLQGATDYRHDFSSVLSEEAIDNLADFLKYGLINETQYIDYAAKKPIGADVSHGKELFDGTCAACHGSDGTQINFHGPDDPEYVGTVASGNPWETLHKIRLGQPGTSMPSALVSGWSMQDMLDVLGYSQTLP